MTLQAAELTEEMTRESTVGAISGLIVEPAPQRSSNVSIAL
jgi:hypothetical protein